MWIVTTMMAETILRASTSMRRDRTATPSELAADSAAALSPAILVPSDIIEIYRAGHDCERPYAVSPGRESSRVSAEGQSSRLGGLVGPRPTDGRLLTALVLSRVCSMVRTERGVQAGEVDNISM
jgi:hypothetical protein